MLLHELKVGLGSKVHKVCNPGFVIDCLLEFFATVVYRAFINTGLYKCLLCSIQIVHCVLQLQIEELFHRTYGKLLILVPDLTVVAKVIRSCRKPEVVAVHTKQRSCLADIRVVIRFK